jgi:hypothetical protein
MKKLLLTFKSAFIICALALAFVGLSATLITSCKKECDKNDSTSDCYTPLKTEWVEINGIKWATRNVDAPGTFAASPESAGMFYQWNRKIGWSSTNPLINSNGSRVWDSTYSESTQWSVENDPSPAGWRMPTYAELNNLSQAPNRKTTINGIEGRLFGSPPNTIFLPFCGERLGTNGALIIGNGCYYSNACYYSNTQDDEYLFALCLGIHGDKIYWFANHKSLCSSIRCVKK